MGTLVGYVDPNPGDIISLQNNDIQGTVKGAEDVGGMVGLAILPDGLPRTARLNITGLTTDVIVMGLNGDTVRRVGGVIGQLDIAKLAGGTGVAKGIKAANVSGIQATVNISIVDEHAGGLIGKAEGDYIMNNSSVSGTVAAGSGDTGLGLKAGGFVGESRDGSNATNLTFNGSVSGTTQVGGAYGVISNAQAGPLFGGTANLKNLNISGTVTAPSGFIGGVIGEMGSFVKLEDSSFSGQVTGTLAGTFSTFTGGLVGFAGGGDVFDSTVVSTSSVTGDNYTGGAFGVLCGSAVRVAVEPTAITANNTVGGLVGASGLFCGSSAPVIQDSYARGAIICTGTCLGQIGGFVGDIKDTTVLNAYTDTAIAVTTSTNVGGFIGRLQSGTSLFSSFWDVEATGQNSSPGEGTGQLEGKTSAEMRDPATFSNAGWDLASIWFPPSTDPPTLR